MLFNVFQTTGFGKYACKDVCICYHNLSGGDWLPNPNPLPASPPFPRQSTVKGIRINFSPTGYNTHLMYGVLAGM